MPLPAVGVDRRQRLKKEQLIVDFLAQGTTNRAGTVKIFSAKSTDAFVYTLHATSTDFCRIFETDMNRLYRLSLLLTADTELAEKCFVLGLADSKNGNPVFKEWARSWARRTIIVNAIRMLRPRQDSTSSANASNSVARNVKDLPAELAAAIGLGVFDRFVFVMSVLEDYSERDCRLLLDCSPSDIAQSRNRALKQLAGLAQIRSGKVTEISAVFEHENVDSGLSPGTIPRSALSA